MSKFLVALRSEFDGLNRQFSDSTALDCSCEPSLTQQCFADECDINQIVARYVKTEVMNVRSDYLSGRFVDLASMPDYKEACNIVIAANEAFQKLPADLRKRFDNDPSEFLDFVSDPSNVDKFEEYGLKEPKAPVEPPLAAPEAPSGAV